MWRHGYRFSGLHERATAGRVPQTDVVWIFAGQADVARVDVRAEALALLEMDADRLQRGVRTSEGGSGVRRTLERVETGGCEVGMQQVWGRRGGGRERKRGIACRVLMPLSKRRK